jgi:O-antigen/teichoic acid export membrane protein
LLRPSFFARTTASLPERVRHNGAPQRTALNGFNWAVCGNLAYAFSQCGILVALARVGSPKLVGQYALALAVTGPVVMLGNLQLRAILASDANRNYPFSTYWQLRFLTAPLVWIVVAAIALCGGYGMETAIVIVVAGGAKSIETLSDLCYGASQRNNRLDLVGKSLIIKAVLSVMVMGALTWATQSAAVGIAGLGAMWLALLLAYDLPNIRSADELATATWKFSRPFNWAHQRQLIVVGLPLGFSIALLSLTVAIPNILVERYLGEREVGIYAAFSSLAWAGIPVINALGQTAMPKLGEFYVAQDRRRLRRVVAWLAALGAALGVAGLIASQLVGARIAALVYGAEYARHTDVLAWLLAAAAALFATRFVGDALTAMRCTKIQVTSQAIVALVVAIGGVAVLPHSGLAGMAMVLTLAFVLRGAILSACFYWETRRIEPRSESYCR